MKGNWLGLVAWLTGGVSAFADVQVTGLFGDNMVLQRDVPVPVWGMASPGEAVTVKIAGVQETVHTNAQGQWCARLPAMKASAQPQQMTIGGKNLLVMQNVLVGDVWVCAGQSNMEMPLAQCDAAQDIAAANFPSLHWIKPSKRALGWPGREVVGHWDSCSPANAATMTAAGFYFSRRIQKETGMPVGLVDISWNGSAIEPWMPAEAFAREPTLAKILENLNKPADTWRDGAKARLDALANWIPAARQAMARLGGEIPPPPPLPSDPLVDEHFPTTIYNGMVYPVTSLAIKGVIWYQGESNGGEGIDSYQMKMRALINGWREVWNQGDFPFYFVQLASFESPTAAPAAAGPYARNREAQLRCLQLPHTGMAVAADIGDEKDIHPKDKLDVGERLAAWALHNEYGHKEVVPSGPLFKSMKVEERKIRLEFDYVGAGLMIGKKDGRQPVVEEKEGKLKQFAVAGADRKWFWAEAVIEGQCIVVSSPQVPNPVAVRYAYDHNPVGCNLYNKDGLPASPFRTDKW